MPKNSRVFASGMIVYSRLDGKVSIYRTLAIQMVVIAKCDQRRNSSVRHVLHAWSLLIPPNDGRIFLRDHEDRPFHFDPVSSICPKRKRFATKFDKMLVAFGTYLTRILITKARIARRRLSMFLRISRAHHSPDRRTLLLCTE